MKILRMFCVVMFAALPIAVAGAQEDQPASGGQGATSANLSPGVADVIKLANAGVSDEVIIAYIDKSNQEFALTTDDIIALNNSKVSPRVITAILQHEGLVSNNQAQESAAPPPVTVEQTPPPAVIVQTPPPPVPYVEVVPVAPGPDYFWRPGHWYWNRGWVWMDGSWIYRRPWVVPVHPVPPRPFVVPDRDWRRR